MDIYSLEFSNKTVRTIFKSNDTRMMQLSLAAGEGLERHMTKNVLALLVLSGKIVFSIDGESTELSPLQMVTLPPLKEHAVKALNQSILLMTQIPGERQFPAEDEETLETVYTHPELRDKIAPELLPFVDDHVEVCEALEALREGFDIMKVEKVLEVIYDELNRHFVYEEDLVFPRLTQVLGGPDVGPVPKLLKEHKKIRTMHDTCSRLVERWHEDNSVQETLDMELQQFRRYLLQHIAKEDNHLFSMASRLLPAAEKEAIAKEFSQREAAVEKG